MGGLSGLLVTTVLLSLCVARGTLVVGDSPQEDPRQQNDNDDLHLRDLMLQRERLQRQLDQELQEGGGGREDGESSTSAISQPATKTTDVLPKSFTSGTVPPTSTSTPKREVREEAGERRQAAGEPKTSSSSSTRISLVAFFDLGSPERRVKGAECGGVETEGQQGEQVGNFTSPPRRRRSQLEEAARWAAGRLESVAEAEIEVTSLDTCGDPDFALSRLLSVAARENLFIDPAIGGGSRGGGEKERNDRASCFKAEGGGRTLFGGILFASSLRLPSGLPVPRSVSVLPGVASLDTTSLHASLALARRLKWRHVALVTAGADLAAAAKKALTHEEICLVREIDLEEELRFGRDLLSKVLDDPSVVGEKQGMTTNFLVVGRGVGDLLLRALLRQGRRGGDSKEGGKRWIIATSEATSKVEEGAQNPPATTGRYRGDDLIFTVVKNYHRAKEFTEYYGGLGVDEAEDPRLTGLMTMEVRLVTEAVKRVKRCVGEGDEASADLDTERITEDVASRVLGLTSEPERYVVRFTDRSVHGLLVANYTTNERLRLVSSNPDVLSELSRRADETSEEDQCEGCLPCSNSVTVAPFLPTLRVDTLTTVLLTVAAVGVLCSVVFAAYLACKSCGEVVEGSQAFTILMLLVFVGMYASLFSFAFSPTRLVCFARIHCTALAYTLLFSVFLARSLMLATADTDGLPGHVSGVVQFSLFFALSSVQVALAAQEWFLRSEPFTHTSVVGRHQETTCDDVGTSFLVRLAYPMVLLGFQVGVCPFILSSRRNYQEGTLFCLGTVACLAVWLSWTVAYFVVVPEGPGWFSVAICCGVIATPSSLLLVIFVPKVILKRLELRLLPVLFSHHDDKIPRPPKSNYGVVGGG